MNSRKSARILSASSPEGFRTFLLQKEQKREWMVLGLIYAVLFVLYRSAFPHLFVYSDSGMYLYSGISGFWNIYRPMGYSWFIAFAGWFGKSELVLFLCQYLLSALATLSLLFTLKYLFPPTKRIYFYVLAFFMIGSPSIMYANNMLMSDSFFCSLTVLWLTSALWLMHRPSYLMLVLHALLLALALMTRYIGLFYVGFSVLIGLWYFKRNRWHSIALIALALIVFQWARSHTKTRMAETVGVEVFSGFGGWQLLNNAVVILPHIELKPAQLTNPLYRQLYADLSTFNDSLYTTEMALSTTLMWNNQFPFKRILQRNIYVSGRAYGEEWVRTGIQFGDFASYLIKKYPGLYIRHYIIPSLIRFFKHHEFIEERVPLVPNDEMRTYFGMDFDQYVYQCSIFQKLNPVRQYTNLVPWVALLLLIGLASWKWKKLLGQPETFWPAVAVVCFVLAYFGASGVASGNTTWRYSITIYQPLLASLYLLFAILNTREEHHKAHQTDLKI